MDRTSTVDAGARSPRHTQAGIVSRVLAMPYALVTYLVGVGGLAWLALSLVGLTPWPVLVKVSSTAGSAALDIAAVAAFGLTHSVMARAGFKRWWTMVVPHWAERSTYVAVAGLELGALVLVWQPLPAEIWSVQGSAAATLLWVACALGWAYLLGATFAIDHFDLFGLRQGYLRAVGREYTHVPFKERWMYRYSRHPMMLGLAIGIWATPHMTAGHLLLAAALTGYILVGLWYEERDLVARFGKRYRHYRETVGVLFTLPGRGA